MPLCLSPGGEGDFRGIFEDICQVATFSAPDVCKTDWRHAMDTTLGKLLVAAAFMCASGCVNGPVVDNSPVSSLDIERYLGTWYEIARFDHSFERGVEEAKAVYTLNSDGSVKIVNSGVKSGKPKIAVGKGKRTDAPALLRVSFFGPFYADYRVMDIDPDYRYALVGGGSSEYLWILSRTRSIPGGVKSAVLAEATRRGYDVSKLICVKHR